ncbi:MAG: PadR family transcriptional regulator, partial [Deltaproteobacteria bacterium]|nr:PadR family transcriptional regulator [Deltaproteobacteria bacterium]
NGRDFGINDGTLYPALRRLEKAGFIRKRVVLQQKSPAKHIYHATREGEEAFVDWLTSPVGEEDPFRYDFYWRFGFLVKVNFFKHLGPKDVLSKVERQMEEARAKIEDFERVRAALKDRQVDWYRQRIMDFGFDYQSLKLAWLEQFAGDLRMQISGSMTERHATS